MLRGITVAAVLTGVDVYVSSLAVEAGAEGSAGVRTKQEKNS